MVNLLLDLLMSERQEVELRALTVGDRFACHFPVSLISDTEPDHVTCGTVLHLGVGSIEVITDGSRDTERWALEVPVFQINEGERIIMATVKSVTPVAAPVAAQPSNLAGLKGSFLSRIAAQEKLKTAGLEAGTAEGMDKAAKADEKIDAIRAEAEAKGVDLTTKAQAKANGHAPEPAATIAAPVKVKPTKAQAGDEAASKRAAALAAHKAASATPRVKKEKVLRPCLDGCGAMVAGNFAIGHDAKLKSVIGKVERGELDRGDVPEVAQGLVKFIKGELMVSKDPKTNVTTKTQLLICTAAPVKIPGRDGFTVTMREAE